MSKRKAPDVDYYEYALSTPLMKRGYLPLSVLNDERVKRASLKELNELMRSKYVLPNGELAAFKKHETLAARRHMRLLGLNPAKLQVYQGCGKKHADTGLCGGKCRLIDGKCKDDWSGILKRGTYTILPDGSIKIGGTVWDPTWGVGNVEKELGINVIHTNIVASDLIPRAKTAIPRAKIHKSRFDASAQELPFKRGSFNTILFDPPHAIGHNHERVFSGYANRAEFERQMRAFGRTSYVLAARNSYLYVKLTVGEQMHADPNRNMNRITDFDLFAEAGWVKEDYLVRPVRYLRTANWAVWCRFHKR